MKNNNITAEFVDENGQSKIINIEQTNDIDINFKGRPYKLQSPENNKYNKFRKKGIFTSEIGVKSSGFAPIFTLALIVALGSAVVVFLLWKF